MSLLPLVLCTTLTVDCTKFLNVSPSGDDVAALKTLALNVGTEFGASRMTEAYQRKLGLKTLRLINVGVGGCFKKDGSFVVTNESPRLAQDLALCRRLGATPHVIIHGLPDELLKSVPLVEQKGRALGIDISRKYAKIGPTDYGLLENWYLGYFEHVAVRRGFDGAVFEIFNEPDLGTMFYPTAKIPARGSPEAFAALMAIYRAASRAAVRFSKLHPKTKILLGGPATTLAFTYQAREPWDVLFIRECARENLRLDFFSFHIYSSIAPYRDPSKGKPYTNYPSLPTMYARVRESIAKYRPGTPVWITEWGPSHCTWGNSVNGSAASAAFALDGLDVFLDFGIERAVWLVTTDTVWWEKETGRRRDAWAWPALCTAPQVFGASWPKAAWHAFKMIGELSGRRVALTSDGGRTRGWAFCDPRDNTLRVVLWNYGLYIPEWGEILQEGGSESVRLEIRGFKGRHHAVLRVIDSEHGDVITAYIAGKSVCDFAEPLVRTFDVDGTSVSLDLPPESCAMLEIGATPTVPTVDVGIPPRAEELLLAIREPGTNALAAVARMEELKKVQGVLGEQVLDGYAARQKSVCLAYRSNTPEYLRLTREAYEAFSAAKRPVPADILQSLAQAARDAGDLEDALAWFRRAESAPEDGRSRFGVHIAVTQVLMALRRFDEAVKACTLYVRKMESEPNAHRTRTCPFVLTRARALVELGDREAFKKDVRRLREDVRSGELTEALVKDVERLEKFACYRFGAKKKGQGK